MSGYSISAVMAVYNPDLDFFRKALDSVLEQLMPVQELILVNDGGGEDFKRVLPPDPRIRVYEKRNEGVAATRNYAISRCSGDYIAFLDQDDFWYPDKLQKQMAMIASPGEVCMVISRVDIVDDLGARMQKESITRVAATYPRKTQGSQFLLHLAEGNFIFSSTPVIHRHIFERIGGFDSYTQPHDDWDMYLRIAFAGFPVHCFQHGPLSVWRVHDANESNKMKAMLRSKCRVERKLLRVAQEESLQMILTTNLLIDYLERDNMLYKTGQFRRYRTLVGRHLIALARDRGNYKGEMAPFYSSFAGRVRKIMIKSARRYVVSYFRG
jgi:glycosyltransferase involved in cell wall biosynthesis